MWKAATATAEAEQIALGGGRAGGVASAAEAVAGGSIFARAGRRVAGVFGRGARAASVAGAAEGGAQLAIPGLEAASGAAKGVGLLSKIPGIGMLANLMKIPGVGLLGKIAAPVAIIQGLFGALSAGRSGSLGHQAAQTAYGGINGATGGLLGGGLGLLGINNILETPEHRAERNISTLDKKVKQEMSDTSRIPGMAARLHAQLRVLDAAASDITDRQQAASKQYIQSLNDQTNAIQQQLLAMKQQQQAAGRSAGKTYMQGLGATAAANAKKVGAVPAFRQEVLTGIQHMNAITQSGGVNAKTNAQRLTQGEQLLGLAYKNMEANPHSPELRSIYQWTAGAVLGNLRGTSPNTNFRISGRRILTGSQSETAGLASTLGGAGAGGPLQAQMAKTDRPDANGEGSRPVADRRGIPGRAGARDREGARQGWGSLVPLLREGLPTHRREEGVRWSARRARPVGHGGGAGRDSRAGRARREPAHGAPRERDAREPLAWRDGRWREQEARVGVRDGRPGHGVRLGR